MQNINQIFLSLSELKITKGDTIMVHGDAGIAAQFNNSSNSLNFFFKQIINYIGKRGTVLVPSFTTSFCKKKKFDLNKSKSEIGLFSEHFRKMKNVRRTYHPIFSFSILGKKWRYFNSSDIQTCFGKNSIFDLFLKINGKILILGNTFEKVVTFVHFIEEYMNINYRFLKKFEGSFINKKIKKKVATSYFVRKLKLKKKLTTPSPLFKILNKSKLGRYEVYSIESQKLFDHCIKKIKKNKYYLVK